MRFTKMQGAGNDYIYLNCFEQPIPSDPGSLAREMSCRNFGVGSDGLILICPSESADVQMVMYNADGSKAEMCGNGIRCVAKFVYDHGIAAKDSLAIETGNGVLKLDLTVKKGKTASVKVDMGEPILGSADIPTTLAGDPPLLCPLSVNGSTYEVTCVSMGNPHCIQFVSDVDNAPVETLGPRIETDPAFPSRTNVEFVQLLSADEIRIRVWERGSGETLACGTGACAVLVAGHLEGRLERKVLAHLRGGDLELEWAENNHVYMTGPAEEVFTGEWPCHDSA